MAEHYLSDDEQLENIKRWLKTHGPAIITGIVLGVAVILGWQYWTGYRTAQAEQASLYYQTLMQAVERPDDVRARQQGQRLIEEFPSTPYGTLGALMLARLAVEEGDMTAAAGHLQWVIEHADLDEVKDIARLRLARLWLAEGKLEQVEAQLNGVKNAGFSAQVEELRGDLYLARNEPDKARAAYQAARTAPGPVPNPELLQIKLDNLPSLTAAES